MLVNVDVRRDRQFTVEVGVGVDGKFHARQNLRRLSIHVLNPLGQLHTSRLNWPPIDPTRSLHRSTRPGPWRRGVGHDADAIGYCHDREVRLGDGERNVTCWALDGDAVADVDRRIGRDLETSRPSALLAVFDRMTHEEVIRAVVVMVCEPKHVHEPVVWDAEPFDEALALDRDGATGRCCVGGPLGPRDHRPALGRTGWRSDAGERYGESARGDQRPRECQISGVYGSGGH